MYKVHCLNNISAEGLAVLSADYELTDSVEEADAILVRSADMHEMELPANLKVIARAGAGVNNIPLQKCADAGIAVFNTPGANANAASSGLRPMPKIPTLEKLRKRPRRHLPAERFSGRRSA